MRLPISSSSKDAIISTSRRTSGSSRSISIFFFVFSTLFNTSARASVSILDKMAAAFFTSISFIYSAAFSSSVYSKISESISVSRIRYSLHRSGTVRSGSTSARSFSWKSSRQPSSHNGRRGVAADDLQNFFGIILYSFLHSFILRFFA